jgi:hypothetical protein
MKAPTPGSQIGTKSRAILECLRQNGRKNRLDLEMLLNMGPLGKVLERLRHVACISMTAHGGNGVGIYDITRHGRQALGESLDLPEPKTTRFCNASMREPLQYEADTTMGRVGLARFGAAQRVGVAA